MSCKTRRWCLPFAEMKGPVKDRLRRYGLYTQWGGTLLPHRGHRGGRLPSDNGPGGVWDWEERPDGTRKG